MSTGQQPSAAELRARVLAEISELSPVDQAVVRDAAHAIRDAITNAEMHAAGFGHLAFALISVELQEQLAAATGSTPQ